MEVTFNLDLNQTKVLFVWNYASKMARSKYWELIAVDRLHFRKKITKLANILNPILECSHRYKIYEERFKTMEL